MSRSSFSPPQRRPTLLAPAFLTIGLLALALSAASLAPSSSEARIPAISLAAAPAINDTFYATGDTLTRPTLQPTTAAPPPSPSAGWPAARTSTS